MSSRRRESRFDDYRESNNYYQEWPGRRQSYSGSSYHSQNNSNRSNRSNNYISYRESSIYPLAIPDLIDQFFIESSIIHFTDFSEEIMTRDLCERAERYTRNQSKCNLWHQLRFGRIGASNIFEASRCRTPGGFFVRRILGRVRSFENWIMRRGKDLEIPVIMEAERQLGVRIDPCGLFLMPSLPMLCATPDGIIGQDFIVEVKCPMTRFNPNGRIKNEWYAQMQFQMKATGINEGYLIVADPDFEENQQISIRHVGFDRLYTDNMIERAVNFWYDHVFPTLCSENN